MKRSFLCTHECMGRIWAYGYLDGVFEGIRRSHSMFHYDIIRRKKALEKGGALSDVRPTCNLIKNSGILWICA